MAMTQSEIKALIQQGDFGEECAKPELVETHISWVIICDEFVFKIKKPIQYSFLDFSTLERRLYYCQRELVLNQRLTSNMYLVVLPIKRTREGFSVGSADGQIVDFALKMRRQDREKQMDVLLKKNEVSPSDIQRLARVVSRFHRGAKVISGKSGLSVQNKFSDLQTEKDFLMEKLGTWSNDLIKAAVEQSKNFYAKHEILVDKRQKAGYVRDGHGDLHARNIFLLADPVIFDCIEFNDEYRQLDVLNEVAFLCMDLDAFNRPVLSELFINDYDELFATINSEAEKRLFVYYKAYRANVRAKVNSLRAREARGDDQKKALSEVEKYLRLMARYLGEV
jgi:uncharacterized protein